MTRARSKCVRDVEVLRGAGTHRSVERSVIYTARRPPARSRRSSVVHRRQTQPYRASGVSLSLIALIACRRVQRSDQRMRALRRAVLGPSLNFTSAIYSTKRQRGPPVTMWPRVDRTMTNRTVRVVFIIAECRTGVIRLGDRSAWR